MFIEVRFECIAMEGFPLEILSNDLWCNIHHKCYKSVKVVFVFL
jgi:hypothetical protein